MSKNKKMRMLCQKQLQRIVQKKLQEAAVAGSFQTNFTSDEIYSFIHMQLDDMSAWTVESYSVTGKGKKDKTYSMPSVNAYVMEPNMDTVYKARDMIKKVLMEE